MQQRRLRRSEPLQWTFNSWRRKPGGRSGDQAVRETVGEDDADDEGTNQNGPATGFTKSTGLCFIYGDSLTANGCCAGLFNNGILRSHYRSGPHLLDSLPLILNQTAETVEVGGDGQLAGSTPPAHVVSVVPCRLSIFPA